MNDMSQPHAAWTPDGEGTAKPTEDALIADFTKDLGNPDLARQGSKN